MRGRPTIAPRTKDSRNRDMSKITDRQHHARHGDNSHVNKSKCFAYKATAATWYRISTAASARGTAGGSLRAVTVTVRCSGLAGPDAGLDILGRRNATQVLGGAGVCVPAVPQTRRPVLGQRHSHERVREPFAGRAEAQVLRVQRHRREKRKSSARQFVQIHGQYASGLFRIQAGGDVPGSLACECHDVNTNGCTEAPEEALSL